MKKGQARIDEFAFVLLAGIVLIVILMIAWGTPTEGPPFVTPNKINIEVPSNATSAFELNVTGRLTNVTLTAKGEIMSWISFNKNNFDVSDSTIVRVRVRVPSSALGTHTASIVVESTGGKQTIPVTVIVKEQEELVNSRSAVLGDFSVRYSVGADIIASEENFEVSKGYFSGYSKDLIGSQTDKQLLEVDSGLIHLVIDETNSAGSLVVIFNGKEVFNKVVEAGEIDIPIDKEQIGSLNTIEIGAGNPGWKFWMNTVYKFSLVKFTVNFKGVSTTDIPFELNKNEIDDFDHFLLNFRVKSYTFPLPELTIKINGQIVFLHVPPLAFFNNTFDSDILGNNLVLMPSNTITFLFEEPASYEAEGAVLTVFYTSLE